MSFVGFVPVLLLLETSAAAVLFCGGIILLRHVFCGGYRFTPSRDLISVPHSQWRRSSPSSSRPNEPTNNDPSVVVSSCKLQQRGGGTLTGCGGVFGFYNSIKIY